ncbi:hypothetical protein ACSSV1_001888 [Labrenzia sp. MBR-25]
MFSGLAIGGPLDGKTISHQSPFYRVPEINPVPALCPSFKVMAEEAVKMDVFEYVHCKTPGGEVWIPNEVQKGERYEHKIWDHPFDYIFSKLIRAYRPDGY